MLRYLSRLSGPLLDRFDMSVEIPLLPKGVLAEGGERGESTDVVRVRVEKARTRMIERAGMVNSQLSGRRLEQSCQLQSSDAVFLEEALHRLGLSIRGYHRILKVARTIADLEGQTRISRHHLTEALGYRAMDRLLRRLNSTT
jgi:magnesium chelatase family protein